MDVINNDPKMSDYFRCSINKEASRFIAQKFKVNSLMYS